MGKAGLSAAHSTGSFILFVLRGVSFAIAHLTPRDHLSLVITGFYNEERPCGRGEELTLFVAKNALRLLRRLRRGLLYDTPTQDAKRRTRVARRVV